jgi:hypothetical protein
VSLLCLAAGFFLLYITWLDGDDDENEPAAVTETPVVVVEQPCPTGWRDFDNTAARYKVCLPLNMVFSTGTGTIALADVSQQDPLFINDFHVVNLAWLNPWPLEIPTDPALPPLRIAIRQPAVDLGIEGCPLRTQPLTDGVQSCSDIFFIRDGQAIPDPAGDFHRFRALIALEAPATGQLFFQADSMTAAWTSQGPLVQMVLDSIRPY